MSAAEPRQPLAHQLHGDAGEVVLLLNGGMMTHGSWAPLTSTLIDSYRVLGCDFRGQLLSPGEAHHSLLAHCHDVVTLLDTLQLDSIHVLGTSFGGEVGLLLAAHFPERVKTLAAVTAVDRTPPGMAEDVELMKDLALRAAAGDAAPFHERLVQDVYSAAYRKAHASELAARSAAALPPAWYRGLTGVLSAVADFDLSAELGRIVCPTLVVHAAQDTVMPIERVRALADGIEAAEMVIHPSSGHALASEDPHWLARTYLAFLGRHAL